MAFLKNAIKTLEEEEEVIMKNMENFQTPIIFMNLSKDKEDAGRRTANRSRQEAERSTETTLFGVDLTALEPRQDMEVRTNMFKRKRASEEPNKTPLFWPSLGTMPTRSTSLSLVSLPDGHTNRVPFSGSSDTMVMGPAPQLVSDNAKRVLENLRQPLSETVVMRPDKGKQVVENLSRRSGLRFRSSNAQSSRPANDSRHVVAPTPALAPAPTAASVPAPTATPASVPAPIPASTPALPSAPTPAPLPAPTQGNQQHVTRVGRIWKSRNRGL